MGDLIGFGHFRVVRGGGYRKKVAGVAVVIVVDV